MKLATTFMNLRQISRYKCPVLWGGMGWDVGVAIRLEGLVTNLDSDVYGKYVGTILFTYFTCMDSLPLISMICNVYTLSIYIKYIQFRNHSDTQ